MNFTSLSITERFVTAGCDAVFAKDDHIGYYATGEVKYAAWSKLLIRC
ncbi:hypothetical protein [Paenibacillus macerans]|nr:hypothetical protein [Paenibacillus macerans]